MAATAAPANDGGDDYFNLGPYRRRISTAHPAAQTWFTRGLLWCYGFNHDEAVACFERSLAAQPTAMAYWGLAYALGPNYNKPWEAFDADEARRHLARAHDAAARARRWIAGEGPRAWPVERALVEAIWERYPVATEEEGNGNAVNGGGGPGGGRRGQWQRAYVAAMKRAYEGFPDDPDVVTLYADAMMNSTPWSLWDLKTGRPRAGAHTREIQTVLERALEAERRGTAHAAHHPGLAHVYIHLMEMSPTPEKAIPAADALRLLVPDAGHLNHMPTHIDIIVGNYQAAMISNLDAIRADDRFFTRGGGADAGVAHSFYTLYRAHDHHFRIYAALFAGNFGVARDTVAELEAALPEALLRTESPPMADWLESFVSMRVHVLIRFGRWAEILALPLPRDARLYCATTAMMHYGRGMALAALGRTREAAAERHSLQAARLRVPRSRTLFNNTCQDILAVGAAMLDGELAYRRGEHDVAFDHLREAVHLSDLLPFDEPWGWVQPPRHALGALLLEQGRAEEAAGVYRADLGLDATLPRPLQHPNNIWSLRGYYLCLRELRREEEAGEIKRQLDVCAAWADVKVEKSCFCANARRENDPVHAAEESQSSCGDAKAKLC